MPQPVGSLPTSLPAVPSPLAAIGSLRQRLASIADAIAHVRAVAIDTQRDVAALREALAAATEESAATSLRLEAAIAEAHESQDSAARELSTLQNTLDEMRAQGEADHEQLLAALEFVFSDEPGQRRRLRQARADDTFELAYSEPDPLVSVVMPTYDNFALMGERSIPSVLAQTHAHLELLVIGDDAPPEAEEVVRSFDDPRVRYHHLSPRGPYPDDPRRRWYVAGSPPFNFGVGLAAGRWIAPMADDDAMRPEHLSLLLERARRDRLEIAYGRFATHYPDERETVVMGEFPPRLGRITLQAAIQHAGLSFFELELADAVFGIPSDWGMLQRMWRAGVRLGMVDDVVVDLYPSFYWNARGVPEDG